MHFHNIGIDNQEGVEEDFQRDLSTEFGEGSEAEAANIFLVKQGKHHFFKSFSNRYCYATPLLFILFRKKLFIRVVEVYYVEIGQGKCMCRFAATHGCWSR